MDQARKALYCLQKIEKYIIPIDLQFKLFDTLILPILTYGCEIWGYENTKQLEKLHLQFCRNILGVRTTTPNVMTQGELGRYMYKIKDCKFLEQTYFKGEETQLYFI